MLSDRMHEDLLLERLYTRCIACYTQYQTYGKLSKTTKIDRNILSLPKSSVIF